MQKAEEVLSKRLGTPLSGESTSLAFGNYLNHRAKIPAGNNRPDLACPAES